MDEISELTEAERNVLLSYGSETYSIFWVGKDRELAKKLESRGLLAWVPEMFGSGISWALTGAGRAVRSRLSPGVSG